MKNVQTIDLKGKDYATVPFRLKQFREDNPNASVETKPMFQDNGELVFSAHILKDKADESSAESTGHSYGKMTGEKAFEKLETIAVGRALALLGYLNNGQVASTEEMEEFNQYKQDQYDLALKEIAHATKREEFSEILAKLSPEQKQMAASVINDRIQELKDNATSNTSPAA